MSMDDQFRELNLFRESLLTFNDILHDGMNSLESHYDSVSPYWQDSWRQEYETHWQPLREGLQGYLTREGPTYDAFLQEKIESLRRYLGV